MGFGYIYLYFWPSSVKIKKSTFNLNINRMAAEATLTQETASSKLWGGGRSPYGVSWGKMMMWFFLVSDAFTFSSLIIAYGALRHRFAEVWPTANDVFTHFPFVHEHLPLAYVGLMTFILIMSSVTMVLAVDAGHRRDNKSVAIWMGLTIIGGFMFLGSQAWEWYNFISGTELGALRTPTGEMYRFPENAPSLHANGAAHPPEWALVGPDHKVITDKAEIERIKSISTPFHGANLVENEYGHPLFADFFFFITGFHGFHVFSGVMINVIIFFNVLAGVYSRRGHYEQIEKTGLYWHFVDLVWVFVFTFFYLV
jgi:cytochrome c oxidase subunit 3